MGPMRPIGLVEEGGAIISAAQPTMPPRQWEFQLSSVEDLRRLSRQLGVSVDATEDVSILAQPVDLGGLVIPNSLAVHPMEGCDGDAQGRPDRAHGPPLRALRRRRRGPDLGRGHRRHPRGPGQSAPVVAAPGQQRGLRRLGQAGAGEGGRGQWRRSPTRHGGAVDPFGPLQQARPGAVPIIPERDPYRDPMAPQPKPTTDRKSKIPDDWPIVTDEYLDKLQDAYVEAARIAFEVGFDAVDIKSCHGYLINELLACHNRPGKYGGSFENRTRFMLDVIDRIRAELGDKARIVTRMGIYDAIPYPYGWGVDKRRLHQARPDRAEEADRPAAQRGVKLINITIANPYYNPHVGRPFNEPIVGGYAEPEHPLAGVARLVKVTGEIQKEFPDMAFVGTGYSWLRTLFANVGAANKTKGLVTLIGAGRMGFAYPDFARDIVNARQDVPGEGLRRLQRLHADHAGQRQDRLRRAGQRGLRPDLRARPDERQGQPAASGRRLPQMPGADVSTRLSGRDRDSAVHQPVPRRQGSRSLRGHPQGQRISGGLCVAVPGRAAMPGPLPARLHRRRLPAHREHPEVSRRAGEQERLVQAACPREGDRQEGRGHRGRSGGSGLCGQAPRSRPHRDPLRQEHRLRRHGRVRDPARPATQRV